MLDKFYEDILPRTGHYALFLGPTKQHVWADSIEDLVRETKLRNDIPDVYFATASFVEPGDKWGGRTADRVHKLRAFRLDIDAGEVKYAKYGDAVYRSQEDALKGAIAFCRDSGLVPAYLVSSGAGLHVYFCLDEDVVPGEWTPVAQALQALAVQHGLRVDSKVTADVARVLRPPGTLHSSGARVSVLRDTGFKTTFAQFRERVGVFESARTYDLSINAEVREAPQGPPKSVAKIVENCAAMAHATTEVESIPEPYWRAMLGLTKHTIEGEEAAHAFSEDHPDYDYEETQRKLDNWTAGPATCNEFSQHFPGCKQCPHWGKVKSPIQLGALTVVEVKELPPEKQPVVEVPETPKGFPWDDKLPGFAFVQEEAKNHALFVKKAMPGKDLMGGDIETIHTVPITSTPFWFDSWAEAADSEDRALVTLHVWNGRNERVYSMSQELLASMPDTLKFLAGKSIHLRNDLRAKKAMEDYIKAQLERIRTMHMRPKINDRFGLRIEDDGSLVCAHGKYVIQPDGSIIEAMLSSSPQRRAKNFDIAALRDKHALKIDSSVWPEIRAAALRYVEFVRKFYRDKDMEPFQLTIMFLLASPLMAFVTGQYARGTTLPSNGLTVSLYSHKSSRGKTYATKVGMLAFGNPEELVKPRDENAATENARRSILSTHGTMPVVMDEMGSADARMVAGIVSAVANGASKERMDTKYGTETPWALINVITCNHAQRDLINQAQAESAAIQLRLLELDVNGIPDRPKEVREAFDTEYPGVLAQCTGALGAFLELAYCRQGVAAMNERVMRCVRRASKAAGNSQEARFQWRAFGAVLAVQEILEQCGLAMFDTETLTQTFVDAFHSGSEYVEETTLPTHGQDLMGLVLNDLKPQTLITDTETHRGHNPNSRDFVLNIGGPPRKVVARHVQKGGYTYLSVDALRAWCAEKRLPMNSLIKDCIKSEVLVHMTKDAYRGTVDLYKGTAEDGTSAPTSVYKVDVNKLKYEEVDYTENVVPLHVAKAEAKPDPNEPQVYTKE